MKILFVSTLYEPNIIGGAEITTQILAEALIKNGHEATVLTTAVKKGERMEEINGVKVYYMRQKNIYAWPPGSSNPLAKAACHLLDAYNPFTMPTLKKVISKEKPDVLHTNAIGGFSVSVWHVAKQMKIPIVHTLHDHYLLCPRTTMFKNDQNCPQQCKVCSIFSWSKKISSQSVDAAVGVSQFLLNRHASEGYFSNALKKVIYNGCELPPDPPSSNNKKNTALRIGYFGRLHSTKGIEFLLQALNNLKNIPWECWIGGKGDSSYEAYLKKTYSSQNISYLGFIQPENFYPALDVLIVPSLLHEALGRVTLEAYAHGIPVIGARRGGIPEVIEENKTGWLFEPDEKDSLHKILSGLSIERCRKMRDSCLKKAKEFSNDQTFEQYLDLYRSFARS